jgi:hypothetical protein
MSNSILEVAPIEAVLRTDTGGRAFILKGQRRNHVLTAAHCLPNIPPAHPWRNLDESTFQDFLSPLSGGPKVWAECLFCDVIMDLAVLWESSGQDLDEECEAFNPFIDDCPVLEMSTWQWKRPVYKLGEEYKPAEMQPGFVLSLENEWLPCTLGGRETSISIEEQGIIKSGMSGSPILDANGKAIGLISTGSINPYLFATLPRWILSDLSLT